MYVLKNTATGQYARHDSTGEHDGKVADDVSQAREFETWGDASDYSQNFGPDFEVFSIYGNDQWEASFGPALRRELPPQ